MKTPNGIKKRLEYCLGTDDCVGCIYHEDCNQSYRTHIIIYARDCIRQLERERDALLADFKLYRERNINRTSGVYACDLCKHGGKYEEIGELTCPEGCDGVKHFQWRGVKEDDDENHLYAD